MKFATAFGEVAYSSLHVKLPMLVVKSANIPFWPKREGGPARHAKSTITKRILWYKALTYPTLPVYSCPRQHSSVSMMFTFDEDSSLNISHITTRAVPNQDSRKDMYRRTNPHNTWLDKLFVYFTLDIASGAIDTGIGG